MISLGSGASTYNGHSLCRGNVGEPRRLEDLVDPLQVEVDSGAVVRLVDNGELLCDLGIRDVASLGGRVLHDDMEPDVDGRRARGALERRGARGAQGPELALEPLLDLVGNSACASTSAEGEHGAGVGDEGDGEDDGRWDDVEEPHYGSVVSE